MCLHAIDTNANDSSSDRIIEYQHEYVSPKKYKNLCFRPNSSFLYYIKRFTSILHVCSIVVVRHDYIVNVETCIILIKKMNRWAISSVASKCHHCCFHVHCSVCLDNDLVLILVIYISSMPFDNSLLHQEYIIMIFIYSYILLIADYFGGHPLTV